MSLGLIVSGPVLRIRVLRLRDSDLLSDRRTSVAVVLPLQNKLDGKDMLALDAARLMIGASARRDLRHHVDLVDLTVTGLRWHKPNALFIADLLGRRQFHSSLLSKVHDFLLYTLYLRNILLARCISVKRYFKISFEKLLDNISLPSILLQAWEWSRSNRKATDVAGVPTNGYPDRAPRVSQRYALSANRRIGISLGNTNSRRDILTELNDLAERTGFEPATPLAEDPRRNAAISVLAPRASGINLSPTSPLSRLAVSGYSLERPFPRSKFCGLSLESLRRNRENQFPVFPLGRIPIGLLFVVVANALEKTDSREASSFNGASFPNEFQGIGSLVIFLTRLNANTSRVSVPPKKYCLSQL